MDEGTQMRILIVDGEPSARDRLRFLLSQTQGNVISLIAEAASGREAVDYCTVQPVELVLLNEHLPDLDALEVARQLEHLPEPPAVLLLTTEEPSTSGIGGTIIARLVKPGDASQLDAVIRQLIQANAQSRAAAKERPFEIRASYRNAIHRVAVQDVIYLRADQKYVTVRHPRGELLVDLSLRFFEDEFPDIFVRIHRNTLVARSRFAGLHKRPDGAVEARVEGCEDPLVVSRRHLTRVRRWLQQAHQAKCGKRA